MDIVTKRIFVSAFAGLCAALAGCGGGSGSDSLEAVGRISLGISDGPISGASKVCIAFTEIEFQSRGTSVVVDFSGAPETSPPETSAPETINLLDFQGANSFPILVNQELPAGEYQWMRLGVDALRVSASNAAVGDSGGLECDGAGSYIVTDEGTFKLYIPSGAESGLKLVGGFTIPVNGTADFTAEFDLKKSIAEPNGLAPDVIFRPTIRLVNNVDVGTLTGEVSDNLVAVEGCDPWVYVFDAGMEEEPDPNDSVATAMVKSEITNDGLTRHNYTVGFLLAGAYKVAFTCNGVDFEPVGGKDAEILPKAVTTVDFLSE